MTKLEKADIFWRGLHELAEAVMDQCSGNWVLKRADIAKRLHAQAEAFKIFVPKPREKKT